MDFAAALANLEKSVQQAARSDDRNDRPRVRPPDHRDYDPGRNQRARYENNNHRGRGGYAGRSQHSRNPLDARVDFGYRCLPYRPLPPPGSDPTNKPKHIALLAISIDDLPYEHIWKEWASSSQQHKVSLLCHAKHPSQVKSPWLRQRLLTEPPKIGRGNSFSDPIFHSHRPEWGSVQITRAMVDLLAAGMEIGRSVNSDREKDERFTRRRYVIDETLPTEVPTVDKFIFISETCLPVTTLDECIHSLFAATATERRLAGQSTTDPVTAAPMANPWEVSWVHARNRNTPGTPRNKYERDQFCDIHRMIPQSLRWKADQWMVLSRPHAAAVLELDQHLRPHEQLWNSYTRVNASDEMYFPTALAVLKILTEGGHRQEPLQVCLRPVTYTDWSEGMRNPATFPASDLRRITKVARKEGCLLARKFSPTNSAGEHVGDITVEEWKKVLDEVTRELADQEAGKAGGVEMKAETDPSSSQIINESS